MENENTYETHDFYSAVLLRVLNFPLKSLIHKKADTAVTFVFLDSENKAEQVIQNYWDRKISLPDIRLFVEAINELKTRIHMR